MSSDSQNVSRYLKDLDTNVWKVLFDTTANMAVKSKIENASLCIIPNAQQTATLVFKINAIVVLTLGSEVPMPIVNVSWENKMLISQNVETKTGN